MTKQGHSKTNDPTEAGAELHVSAPVSASKINGNRSHVNDRHDRFAREYVIDLNGSRAAVAAGYSAATANVIGAQLLAKVSIRKRVDELLSKRASKLDLKAEKVLEELARLAFSNMEDYIRVQEDGDAYVDLSQLTRDKAAAIQELTVEDYVEGRGENARDVKRVKFKLADKQRALELLGKNLKLFGDSEQIPFGVGIQIGIDILGAVVVTK